MMRPRVTSEPRTLSTYSWDSMPSSSWMRTAGITTPSSPAIWRRIMLTRRSSDAARASVDQRHEPEADRQLQRIQRRALDILLALAARRAGRGAWRRLSASSVERSSPGIPLRTLQPIAAKIAAMNRNGSLGSPGTSANSPIAAAATSGALRWPRICPAMSEPRSRSEAERVTMMPVATEINSAGICAASPSPTVSSENWWVASLKARWCWATPTTIPPTRLIAVMITAAIASPFTNFEAPSIAP